MWLDDPRARQLIIAATLVGIALRLTFGLLYWTNKPLTHDEREYLVLAANLAEGRGFVYGGASDVGTGQWFGRAPGYPLLLAAIGAGSTAAGSSPARVKVIQAIIGGGIVWLVGVWALRSGGPGAGVAASAIAAVYPPLVWMPAYVLSETLYSAAALLAALLLQVAVDESRSSNSNRAGGSLALGAGVVAGAATLVRPAMLFFLPAALIWLLLTRRAVLAFALIAGTVAVVSPWTVRNLRVHGRFILVASEGGVTFWTGNHPLARGEGDLAANPELKHAELEFRRAHPGLSSEDLEPLYYRAALQWIVQHPGEWIALLFRKMYYVIVPTGPSYAVHSFRYRVASIVSYVLLLPLAAVGMPWLARGRRPPAALFLLAASAVLVCLLFFPQERFRIPVIDPVLIICVGGLFQPRP
jgi:4-amino-4-deoxy-L-arabinose transferase-like glycosyltransferase